ncbi:flavin reductase family protein [Mycolicibacterium anyangense]|jgi:flavin reductase (DIM6/NTAB) family NADH-FMN oxidoreductase RutF|nr:flavin reductase family protein [Mycolicibacterium anyangense]
MTAPSFDNRLLRDVFGCHPSGIVFVGATVDSDPCGMAVSTFTPVSLDPPLVSVCVQNTSSTWPRLSNCSHLGISVLSYGHSDAVPSLSAKTGDRFTGVTVQSSANGAVFLGGCSVWIETVIHQVVEAGDHSIVILRITDITQHDNVQPIIFYRSRCHGLAAVEA